MLENGTLHKWYKLHKFDSTIEIVCKQMRIEKISNRRRQSHKISNFSLLTRTCLKEFFKHIHDQKRKLNRLHWNSNSINAMFQLLVGYVADNVTASKNISNQTHFDTTYPTMSTFDWSPCQRSLGCTMPSICPSATFCANRLASSHVNRWPSWILQCQGHQLCKRK